MSWVKVFAFVLLINSMAYAEVTSSEIRLALNKAHQYSYYNHEIDPIIRAIDNLVNEHHIKNVATEQIANSVYRAAYITGVDWKVILSIVFVESSFTNTLGDKRKSGNGYWAYGHMQVHLKWWGESITQAGITKEDMLNPYYGIVVGSLILDKRIERYGLETGIRYYNGRSPESHVYLKKVMRIYHSINSNLT